MIEHHQQLEHRRALGVLFSALLRARGRGGGGAEACSYAGWRRHLKEGGAARRTLGCVAVCCKTTASPGTAYRPPRPVQQGGAAPKALHCVCCQPSPYCI